MRHLSYAAMLAFCLAGTLPLHRYYRLGVLRQVRRLALAVLPVAAVFLAWDVWATGAGHWRFDPAQTLPVRIAGLPLEEAGFFIVIPVAGILTFEAVSARRRRRAGHWERHGQRHWERHWERHRQRHRERRRQRHRQRHMDSHLEWQVDRCGDRP